MSPEVSGLCGTGKEDGGWVKEAERLTPQAFSSPRCFVKSSKDVVSLSRLTAAAEFCRGGLRWPAAHVCAGLMLRTLESQSVSLNGV